MHGAKETVGAACWGPGNHVGVSACNTVMGSSLVQNIDYVFA